MCQRFYGDAISHMDSVMRSTAVTGPGQWAHAMYAMYVRVYVFANLRRAWMGIWWFLPFWRNACAYAYGHGHLGSLLLGDGILPFVHLFIL